MNSASEIDTTASVWLVRREEPDWSADDEAEFCHWLDESDSHKAAYWRLECAWRMADRIGALGLGASGSIPDRRVATARWLPIAASVMALLLTVPLAIGFLESRPEQIRTIQLSTGVGGHQEVTLTDGSTVELNTTTMLRATVSGTRRDVWLEKGEAFFSVAHSTVPFVVHAGRREITVVGTKFSVNREGARVQVAVLEGTVRVSNSDQAEAAPAATITHGDLLQGDGGSTLVIQKASARVERVLAWRDGMLQFDQTPLIDAAQEFNRYNERKLIVDGQPASIMRIGGSFRSSNVEGFARLLHDAYGLHVEYTSTTIKISG